MLKVAAIVKDILFSSEPELTALSRQVLNLSAYAKRIHSEVERRALKKVQVGTIVVALSRLCSELRDEDPLLPKVVLDSIAVKSNLAEITFNKTTENKMQAQKLAAKKHFEQADFLATVFGVGEISIFCPMSLVKPVIESFKPEKPRLLLGHLAALTVQFGDTYIETPNMYFALLRAIAVRKLNIVELISTYTELTFLVRQKDLNELFVLMNALMRQTGDNMET